ncbi:unnamed protein product, partial [marine sediment metagenome]
NMSTKAGVPVAAVLTVNIAAVVDSQTILEDSEVYGFAAGETHTFEFSMTVPVGTGGKAGAVVAEVVDPSGNKLADGSLDVVVAVVDFVYSDPVNGYHYHTGYWKSPNYECTITNQGTLKGMRIITLTIHRTASDGYVQEHTESFELTLESGQSYRFIYVNEYPCPPWVCDKILLGVGDRVKLFLSDNAGGGEGSYVSWRS